MPLEKLERRQFMTRVREALIDRVQGGGGGYMGGPTAGRFGMMSSSPASAGEMGAFNEKKKRQALYGKYGKGGLEREKMGLGATLKREEFAKDKTLRDKMETGATKRAGILDATKRKESEMRYGRGTSYGTDDRGFEYHKLDKEQEVERGKTKAFQERTEAWKKTGTPRPQFIPGDPDFGTQDRMFGRNPVTGGYDVSNVPTRDRWGTGTQTMEMRPGEEGRTEPMPLHKPGEQGKMQLLSDKKKKKKGWDDWRSYAD